MLAALLLVAETSLLAPLPARHAWTGDAVGGTCVAGTTAGHTLVWHDGVLTQVPHADDATGPERHDLRIDGLDHPPSGVDAFRGGLVLCRADTAEVWVISTSTTPKKLGGPGRTLTTMNGPADVACNGRRIAVADRGNRRVLLLDMTGANLGMYDAVNHTALALPSGVAMDARGNLFITDEATHMVHALGLDGTHRWSTGGWGKAPGRFAEPAGIDVKDGVVLVADRLNHRIQALDANTGATIDWWGMHAVTPREGDGRIHYPEDVAFTDFGCVVAEPFERRIQAFVPGEPDRAKAPTGPLESQSHFGPRMAQHGRTLVVWEPEMRAFHLLDLSRDVPVHMGTFGEHGTGPGCIEQPVTITFEDDADGTLLHVIDAADGHRHTWRLNLPALDATGFDPNRAVFMSSSVVQDAPIWSPFNTSAKDSRGWTWSLDDDAVVRVTDALGQPAMVVGGHGTEHGTFWNPTELLIDDRDRVIVLDHGNHRLQAFDLNGDWLMTFGTGRAYTPQNTPSMRPQDTDDE